MGNLKETSAYSGSGLKFKLLIESPGFSMEDNNFEIELFRERTSVKKIIRKGDMFVHDDGSFIFTFQSEDFGPGEVLMKTTAHVPDSDFPGGIRKEVKVTTLCRVL